MSITKLILVLILGVFLITGSAYASHIDVEDQFDFKLALDFAFLNNIDTLVLTTSGGLYTTTDTNYFQILEPLTIVAAPGLAEKPIITHSDDSLSVLEIFRIYDDFTVVGVIFDGGHAQSHGMKYALRVTGTDDTPPSKVGLNVTVKDCDFRDFFEDKDPTKDGHGLYFLINAVAGTVRVEDCSFENFGYESIRISETEKFVIEKVVDTLIVRNCTFNNIDNEAVRFYADLDTSTKDAYVLLEHITVYGSAPETFYIKNNAGTQLRDVIISDSRPDGRGDRSDWAIEIQGVGSHVSHVDTFNMYFNPISQAATKVRSTKGGTVDTTTVWGFDPQFVDPLNGDFTLAQGSPLYGIAYSGDALGDLRWAQFPLAIDERNPAIPARFSLQQNYPNPFNPSTTIKYSLSKLGYVKLKVYDITGAHIASLVNAVRGAGEHTVNWSAQNISSGIYFYHLEVDGNLSETRKMMLLK